ncbi:MAG: class I SAM-dependent methyltransferase [Proteobacteria bacterium]|nr:class I SAM-dependent methyltransferase [Pseudomonadota bacterium]
MSTDPLQIAIDHFRNGRLTEADNAFNAVLLSNPDNIDALNIGGMTLFKLGRHDDAVKRLQQALGLNAKNPGVLMNLGMVQRDRGLIDAAEECFAAALDLDPENELISNTLDSLHRQPITGAPGALQGAHAPERQIYMSATVSLLSDRPSPLNILEIGSYMGASAITWAKALDKLYDGPGSLTCVDPWDGSGDAGYQADVRGALESETAYNVFRHNISTCPDAVPVLVQRGTSRDILPNLETASFDIVYVDGSHLSADVQYDLQEGDRLLADDGILCGDDLELQAHECDLAFARNNSETDFIADPKTGRKYHPGVTIAVFDFLGTVSAFSGFWAMRKMLEGYQPVDFQTASGIFPTHWPAEFVELAKQAVVRDGYLANIVD